MKVLKFFGAAVIVVLVAFAGYIAWGINYTSSPEFCSSCHATEEYAQTAEHSTMGKLGVGCTDCHFEEGTMGYVRGKVYSLIKLTEQKMGNEENPPKSAHLLTNSSCLQCHGEERNPNPKFAMARNVLDPQVLKPKIVDPNNPASSIIFPHDFHVEKAKVACADCHAGVAHGAELTGGEARQAKADPTFCANCHTGDTAPVLFGDVKESGKTHPGQPNIDTAVWRNNHWRLTEKGMEITGEPGVIEGVKYDKINKEACLVCHEEPARDKKCKSCHFYEEPEFAPSEQTRHDSRWPVLMLALVALMWSATLLPSKARRYVYEGWIAVVAGTAVIISDVYVLLKVIAGVGETTTGAHEVGPTTLWVAYLMASLSLIILLFHQGVLKPRRRRLSGYDRD